MHPLSAVKKQYIATWIVASLIYVSVLIVFLDLPIFPSIVEGLTFNTFCFALGYSYWFVVKYNQPKGKDYVRVLATHLVSVSFLLFVVIGGASVILELIFVEDKVYLDYLYGSGTWKIITVLTFFVVVILFYYLSLYYSQVEESSSREIQLKGLVKEAELQALKSQINPHFIFNSLNSINTLIHIEAEKASEMLVKLSQFLRFSLSKENNELNKLSDELENIQRYLDIEKVRFGDKLQLKYEIDKECRQCSIPALLLQPLLENAIKFGVYENMEESLIHIKTEKKENYLAVKITNNFEPGATYKKGSGIGLKNVEERLKLMYQTHGLIRTEMKDQLFTVELKIPQPNGQDQSTNN